MEDFEGVVMQYNPMIHKIIRSLHIYKNEDEFYQIGLIGLWEAYKSFNDQKGSFLNYAYTHIKCRCLTEMNKAQKRKERNFYPTEEYWSYIEDPQSDPSYEIDFLHSYCHELTENETKWFQASFFNSKSIKEIAESEHVSPTTVKLWRANARKKIAHAAGIHSTEKM